MRYLLLIAEEEPVTLPSEADWATMMDEYRAYTRWLKERGWYGGGEALQPASTATTVSVRDGQRIVTDGPFAETKETLGGYYLLEVENLDDAIEAAVECPGASHGTIELRPVAELPEMPEG